jgi:hypothetical protein
MAMESASQQLANAIAFQVTLEVHAKTSAQIFAVAKDSAPPGDACASQVSWAQLVR